MSRKVLTSLLFSLALVAQSGAQEIFVPRELKAQPVHPLAGKEPSAEAKTLKPKELVRRAEPATDVDAKAKAPKAEIPAVKAEKATVAKESTKTEKAPVVETEPATKKVADTAKSEPAKARGPVVAEKKSPAKTLEVGDDSVATIKVEKAPAVAKQPASGKTVAKTEPAKAEPKKEKLAQAKEKAEVDVPTIKVEKAAATKESPAAARTIAKTEPTKPEPAKEKTDKAASSQQKPSAEVVVKTAPAKSETAIAKAEKAPKEDVRKPSAKPESVQIETFTAKTEKPVAKEQPATVAVTRPRKDEKLAAVKEGPAPSKPSEKQEPPKSNPTVAKAEKAPATKDKPVIAKAETLKPETNLAKIEPPSPREGPKAEIVSIPSQKDQSQILPAAGGSLGTGFTRVADGFDFPVGKPEAEGYYKARGFRPNGHLGEDWDGVRGGDTDMRDPIYSIGDGIVVFARDVHLGWGNVIIVRHAYREGGNVKYIDALYGHLNTMLVGQGQRVSRGQQIATMGNAHGRYDAHLHFEIRKNLEIGMSRAKFQKDFSNYYDPTQFIASHRHLSGGGANYKVAMNTFTHDWMFHFDSNRNFPRQKRSTSESSAALRRALTSTR